MISHRIFIIGLSKLQLLLHFSLRGAMRKSSPQGTQSSRHLGVPSRAGVGLQIAKGLWGFQARILWDSYE